MNEKFNLFREQYKTFYYNGFSVVGGDGCINLTFDFEIEGLCSFHPTTKIITENLNIINRFDSPEGRAILFSLGMVELISYWKCACPPKIVVRCGSLDSEDALWWKRLWWGGLGEMFYRNAIETDFDSFVDLTFEGEPSEWSHFESGGLSLVPVGGGKDSDVTLSLLGEIKPKIKCFTVNDQTARTQGVLAAGLTENDIVKTYRTIAPELLELNKKGFLNGHTPFSAIVAFLGAYCAYLIGAQHIVLSNESSANEASVAGMEVNHQFSKSYEFEQAFNAYIDKHFGGFAEYFSLLRPFNELQIAKQFAALPQFHGCFVSCNVGSKKNIWCGKCAKCLFVYIILSPFLSPDELKKIFGKNMLDDIEMKDDFIGLTGRAEAKPFECVGTVGEVCAALARTKEQYIKRGEELPVLLKDFESSEKIQPLLCEYNSENSIPESFKKIAEEMYKYVSAAD